MPRMKATGQPDSQPDNQPDNRPETVDSTRAAQFLGVTEDAIRKRIARGTLEGYKEDGKWFVRLPDNDQKTDRTGVQNDQTGKDGVIAELRDRVASLETQISQKDHQLGEMLIVVRQSQAMLQAPQGRPWWRFWG